MIQEKKISKELEGKISKLAKFKSITQISMELGLSYYFTKKTLNRLKITPAKAIPLTKEEKEAKKEKLKFQKEQSVYFEHDPYYSNKIYPNG